MAYENTLVAFEQGGAKITMKSGSEVDFESGSAIKIAGTDKTSALAAVVAGLAAGYKLARGSVAATASAVVATGLTTITGFAVTPLADTATKANTCALATGSASGGNLTLKRWKATNASTTTLIAATTAGTLSWIAVGT